MESYAPHSEQPKLKREKADLNAGEQAVFDLFTNTQCAVQYKSFGLPFSFIIKLYKGVIGK